MIAWLRERRTLNDAASWYARMQEPDSAEEVAAFEAWLMRDPARARAYAELEVVANASSKVSARRVATARPGSLINRPVMATAAVLLALLGTFVLWPYLSSPAYAAISNPGPAVRGVRLADGTAVWLDDGAEIGVRFADAGGQIAVRRGRVRIIPHLPAKPLKVIAGDTRTLPGATGMDVRILHAGVAVGALDGPLTVEVRKGLASHTVTIPVGAARVIASNGVRVARVDRTWPASRLRFDRAPLGQILALANRAGDPAIRLGDPALAVLRISGVFDLRDTRSLARKLAATLNLELVERKGSLILQP